MIVIWTAITLTESGGLIAFLLFYPAAIHLGTSPAHPDFTIHRDRYHQPRPFYFESDSGCFVDWLRTGRLKQNHNRKAQLKSRPPNSSIRTTSNRYRTPTSPGWLLNQPLRLPIAHYHYHYHYLTRYLSQLEPLVPGKVCDSGPREVANRRTHLLHPRIPGKASVLCT